MNGSTNQTGKKIKEFRKEFTLCGTKVTILIEGRCKEEGRKHVRPNLKRDKCQ